MEKFMKLMKGYFGEFLGLSAFCMIIWPLLDMVYCHFLTHSVFEYSVRSHIVSPLIFGAVFALIGKLFSLRKARA